MLLDALNIGICRVNHRIRLITRIDELHDDAMINHIAHESAFTLCGVTSHHPWHQLSARVSKKSNAITQL